MLAEVCSMVEVELATDSEGGYVFKEGGEKPKEP